MWGPGFRLIFIVVLLFRRLVRVAIQPLRQQLTAHHEENNSRQRTIQYRPHRMDLVLAVRILSSCPFFASVPRRERHSLRTLSRRPERLSVV